MITELSHLHLKVQEIKFPYDRSYLCYVIVKFLVIAEKKRLSSLLPMIITDFDFAIIFALLQSCGSCFVFSEQLKIFINRYIS